MNVRHQGQHGAEQENSVHGAKGHSEPPRINAEALEHQEVEEGEDPAADQIQKKTGDHRPAAIAGDECAEEKRKAHAGKSEPLGGFENDVHQYGCGQSPEDEVRPSGCAVHHRPLTRSGFSSASAALISPTWVRPCGKLPVIRPLPGSISSPNSNSSLAPESARWKSSSAS